MRARAHAADTPSDDDVETRTNYAISWSQEPSRSQENCLQLPLKYTFFRPIFPRFLVFSFSMSGRIEWVQFGIMFRSEIHLSTETAKFLNSSQERRGVSPWGFLVDSPAARAATRRYLLPQFVNVERVATC